MESDAAVGDGQAQAPRPTASADCVTASAAGPGAAERAGRGPEPRTRRCAYPPTGYRSLPIASKLCQDGALPTAFFRFGFGLASLRFALLEG